MSSTLPVLLIDDEQQILFSYSTILRAAGIENVLTIQDSRQVLPLLAGQDAAVIVLDLLMPHISGTELLIKIKQEFSNIAVIIMTANSELDQAVECMKIGASDYLVKPVEKNRFISAVKRTLDLRNLQDEVFSLRRHLLSGRLEHEDAFSSIITNSKNMLAIFRYIEAISKSQKPVFITGETGVGKELIAKAIHRISGLKGSFVAVNVAGLDDTMFSDTLFGHKKGAFTGADKDREGLIIQAAGGTLLLDEIGDLTESSQVKLLRLLEEGTYYPLGSDIPGKSNARIIAVTNHDIKKLISDEKFRKDLYYRLCSHYIHVPPLWERTGDIPLLLDHFLEQAATSLNKRKPTPPKELVTLLSSHSFPGNVRELQAMVFDAVAQHRSGILSMDSFREVIRQKDTYSRTGFSSVLQTQDAEPAFNISGHFPTLKESEDYLIAEAMKRSNSNQNIAASLLGITRQALNKRLKRKPRSP